MSRGDRRVFTVILVIGLVIALVTGCSTAVTTQSTTTGTTEGTTSGTTKGTSADTTSAETTSAETTTGGLEPITFKAFYNSPMAEYPWGQDPITQEITKRTGVTIELTTPTTDDNQQFNIMLASNSLPDFVIVGVGSPLRSTLWQQDYVYAINELIDQYLPSMWDTFPTDMENFYREEDGNMYFIWSWYSDIDRIASLKGANVVDGALCLNSKMYTDLGSPSIATLENYFQTLLSVKEALPDIPYYALEVQSNTPSSYVNMGQLISRIYGGGDYRSIKSDGTVQLNFREDSYKKAMIYMNRLYQAGLYNAENFTIKGEQFAEIIKNQRAFSVWGPGFNVIQYDLSEAGPYDAVIPPQEAGIPLKLKNNSTSIGGASGVYITKNCSDPERALKYLDFLVSDEGQLLLGYGLEGTNYTYEEDALKYADKDLELLNTDFGEYVKQTGVYNFNYFWITHRHTDVMCYYWLNKGSVKYNGLNAYNQFANNERMNEIIEVANDSNEKVIETRIMTLWTNSYPTIIMAKSEAECVENLQKMIAEAESLGLAALEKAYTDSYQKWQKVLN